MSLLRHRSLRPLETFSLPDNPQIRITAVDSLMVRRLYWYGESGYEGAELHWWRLFCSTATTIVELGANIGYYTVQGAIANPRAIYVAVEPHPVSAELARTNLAINGMTQVQVLQKAVVGTKTTDTMTLWLPDEEQYAAPTGAFLQGAEGVTDRPASTSVTVPVVRASDVVAGADLLKLDIEGYECDVLMSVRDEVAAAMPVIFLEVRRKAGDLRNMLADWHATLGYAVFAIGTHSLHLLTTSQLESADPLPR